MGFNSASNAVFLLVLLICTIGINLILTIQHQIEDKTLEVLANLNLTPNPTFLAAVANMQSTLVVSARFLLWFMIALNMLSSFINSTNILDYVLGSLACFIMSAMVLVIGTALWNGYIVYGGNLLDFGVVNSSLLMVVDNWQALVVGNLFAGLCSFVWAARGTQGTREGGAPYYR